MGTEGLTLMSAATPGSAEHGAQAIVVHEPVRLAAPAPRPDSPDTPVAREQVQRFAELVGEAVSRLNHGIRYEIDKSTNTVITKVIDRETNEVIRQIPADEMLDMMHRVRQYIGVLLDIEA